MSSEEPKPRYTGDYFWEEAKKAIESGDLDAFKKLQISKREINSRFPPFVHLDPKPTQSNRFTCLEIRCPTLLQYCIMNERNEFVEYLLKTKKPNPLIKCEDGSYNALHVASMVADTKCLELLLKCKTVQETLDTPILLKFGQPENREPSTNALHIAVNRGLLKTVLLLASEMPTPEYGPVSETDQSQVPLPPPPPKPVRVGFPFLDDEEEEEEEKKNEEMINHGLDVNSYTTNGTTALHNSTYLKNLNMSYLLICLDANPNKEKEGSEDDTNSDIPEHTTPLQMVEGWENYDKEAKTGEIKKKRFLDLYHSYELIQNGNYETPVAIKTPEQCKKLLDQGITNLFRAQIPNTEKDADNEGGKAIEDDLPSNQKKSKKSNKSYSEFQQILLSIEKISQQISVLNNRVSKLETKKPSQNNNNQENISTIILNPCHICGSTISTECPICHEFYCSKHMNKPQHKNSCHS